VLSGSSGLQYQLRVSVSSGRQSLCDDVTVPLFWASYAVNPDGSGTLYASGTDALSASRTSSTLTVSAPSSCGAWFVGHDADVPASLPEVDAVLTGGSAPGGPFWDYRHQASGLVAEDSDACPTEEPTTTPPSGPVSASP
jgi:hypothetical protein